LILCPCVRVNERYVTTILAHVEDGLVLVRPSFKEEVTTAALKGRSDGINLE